MGLFSGVEDFSSLFAFPEKCFTFGRTETNEPMTRQPKYAQVLLPLPVDELYTYRIPEELLPVVQPGVQVIVPFGGQMLGGVVYELVENPPIDPQQIKYLHDIVSETIFADPALLKTIDWIAGYYICHRGEALRLLNPMRNLHSPLVEVYPLVETAEGVSGKGRQVLEVVLRHPGITLKALATQLPAVNVNAIVYRLRQKQLVRIERKPPKKRKIFKTEQRFQVSPAAWEQLQQLDARQRSRREALLNFLQNKDHQPRRALQAAGFSEYLIRKMVSEGLLQVSEHTIPRDQAVIYSERPGEIQLTEEQQAALTEIQPLLEGEGRFRAMLLHGITGSGKTQVYIEMARKAVEAGKDVIILVPEIALTPQTQARFYHYFGDKVAVLHSRLSRGEKLEVLERIRNGEFQLVVGPRSAVFAPFRNLGLIIVDEEHENSYKQMDGVPRYNARDVALYRGFLLNIPVVLGSATPSFESLYHARSGNYTYVTLNRRINTRAMPRLTIVDLRNEWGRQGEMPILSENLQLKIEARLISREQVMLLLNRRGFSPYIQCKECGYIAQCPNCDISLTYHQTDFHLRCHYCGHQEVAPDACPGCGSLDILFRGIGTQRLEEAVRQLFPHARILRMDQDTTRGRHGHAEILEKFRNGEADILIGTRMIAKGLDFQNVTLVGIINADQGLRFPDFRASEKVFQLLVQAAGRAGRGAAGGEVVIQTMDPRHYIFDFLTSHDYIGFYEREVETRQALKYPPFARILLIRVVGDDEQQVWQYAMKIRQFLNQARKERRYQVLGPAPSPIPRVNNQYRYQILVKQTREEDSAMVYLRQLIKKGIYLNPDVARWPVKVQIDVDPVDIL